MAQRIVELLSLAEYEVFHVQLSGFNVSRSVMNSVCHQLVRAHPGSECAGRPEVSAVTGDV